MNKRSRNAAAAIGAGARRRSISVGVGGGGAGLRNPAGSFRDGGAIATAAATAAADRGCHRGFQQVARTALSQRERVERGRLEYSLASGLRLQRGKSLWLFGEQSNAGFPIVMRYLESSMIHKELKKFKLVFREVLL